MRESFWSDIVNVRILIFSLHASDLCQYSSANGHDNKVLCTNIGSSLREKSCQKLSHNVFLLKKRFTNFWYMGDIIVMCNFESKILNFVDLIQEAGRENSRFLRWCVFLVLPPQTELILATLPFCTTHSCRTSLVTPPPLEIRHENCKQWLSWLWLKPHIQVVNRKKSEIRRNRFFTERSVHYISSEAR